MKREYMEPDAEWIRYEGDVITGSSEEEIEYGEQEHESKYDSGWGSGSGYGF